MINMEKILYSKKAMFIIIAILFIVTLFTNYYGSTDIGDYADSAKYFAGDYSAKIRNSHSYLFGFIHAPLLKIYPNFIWFKITSLIFIFGIIYSVYYMSNKNKKALWLILLSPAVWYMAPWINPIQLASLCLLWAWYFIYKYDKTDKLRYLIYSGILVGFGWAVWNTILFFGIFLTLAFLFNRKFSHMLYFWIFVFIGLLPNLILDHFIFNFAFYTVIKTTLSNILATFLGGIYENSKYSLSNKIIPLILIIITIPFSFWRLYGKNYLKENYKSIIFITLSILLILINPQIRYIVAVIPIIVVLVSKEMNYGQFKKQLVISAVILLIFVFPYLIQISYGINGEVEGTDIRGVIQEGINLNKPFVRTTIIEDMNNISHIYPSKTFIIGNAADDYATLARHYWGENVVEFVSIQDYELWKNNQSILFEKELRVKPNIADRRVSWISGGIGINEINSVNYSDIDYAIGINEPVKLEGFSVIYKTNKLYVSRRVNL